MSHSMRTGCLIIMISVSASGCTGKKFRAPIVFRSPVVSASEEHYTRDRSIASLPAPTDEGIRTLSEQESPTTVSSPADIPLLSQQDLVDTRFSILGRISMNSVSEKGFNQDKAIRGLKIEAFKRYGRLAQGIINLELKGGGGVMPCSMMRSARTKRPMVM